MTAPIGGVGASPASSEMGRLARDLHKMEASGRRHLAARFATIGQPLLATARRNAGWSSRIPAAISVKGIANQNTARIGLQLRVSARDAPHARPYEGISQQGTDRYWRHPVFGHDVWVSQQARPYAMPAVLERSDDARRAVLDAYEDAARDAGFR